MKSIVNDDNHSETKQKRNNSKEKTKINPQRGTKRICIPIKEEEYQVIIEDANLFRTILDQNIIKYPAIFPPAIKQGYKLNGWVSESQKIPDVRMRRICLTELDDEGKKQVYNIAPSFVMPYMVGYTEDVEKGLFGDGHRLVQRAITRGNQRNLLSGFGSFLSRETG
jgi:hypothetical protein